MERSRPLAPVATFSVWSAVTAGVDLLGRLAAPASLVSLAHGHALVAMGAAAVVSSFGLVRGLLSGVLGQRLATKLWVQIADAVGEATLLGLRSRPSDQQAWRLVDAAHQVTELNAQVAPRVAADLVALLVVSLLVVWRLGPVWLLVGLVSVAAFALLVVPGQRAARRADEQVWEVLTDIGTDLDVLLDAAAEVRAHGRDAWVQSNLLARAADMARKRRQVQNHSAFIGLFPVGIALLAAAAPVGTGALRVLGIEMATIAEVAILGGTGFLYALSLVRNVEAGVRIVPQYRMLASVLQMPKRGTEPTGAPSSWLARVELDEVAVRYPGAAVDTPPAVSLAWDDKRGLALVGANGSGKTTLSLVLLGLIEPTSGAIRVGGHDLAEADLAGLRKKTLYLPQKPFFAPDRSLAWHLTLASQVPPSTGECVEALHAVGLAERLEGRTRGRTEDVVAIPAGTLSGGELRRLHLARLFLPGAQSAELVVVDEPDAGLDDGGRAMLKTHLETLARSARVLLITHSESVIPESFARLELGRGSQRPLARG